MTSTSLVTPCFEKKFVTNIQRLTKTKYEIPQSRLRITTYEFLNPVFQCTHVIANSSLNIADQERRERNPDNKKDQLKTTLHNTRTFYYLYTCKTVVLIIIYSSIELTLVFDRTDYRFRSKRTSIETTFDRTDLLLERTCYLLLECYFSYLNASQFDRRSFRSKVVSIDKSRFDRRQESVRSKTVTIA